MNTDIKLAEYARSDGGKASSLHIALNDCLLPTACQIKRRRPITNQAQPSFEIEALQRAFPRKLEIRLTCNRN